MALIECPDCGKQVSESAPACPSCGRPMAATTVEQTGKVYKGWQLIGALLIIIGVVMFIADSAWAIPIGVAGLFLYIWARTSAWWSHG